MLSRSRWSCPLLCANETLQRMYTVWLSGFGVMALLLVIHILSWVQFTPMPFHDFAWMTQLAFHLEAIGLAFAASGVSLPVWYCAFRLVARDLVARDESLGQSLLLAVTTEQCGSRQFVPIV